VYGKVPDTDEARRAIKPTGRFEKVFDNMMLDHNVDMDRTTGRRGVLVVCHMGIGYQQLIVVLNPVISIWATGWEGRAEEVKGENAHSSTNQTCIPPWIAPLERCVEEEKTPSSDDCK
jgi:hypothetical protein